MKPISPIHALIREFAAKPGHFKARHIAGNQSKVWDCIDKAVKAGWLHRVKISYRNILLFGDAREAMAYATEHAPRGPVPVVMRRVSQRQWAADAPMHFPTHADGSPAWIFTRGPSPADPMRTNTFSEAP